MYMLTGELQNKNNPVLRLLYLLYRDELPKLLNLSQSTIDRLIRDSTNGIENKYFKKLGIKVEIQK